MTKWFWTIHFVYSWIVFLPYCFHYWNMYFAIIFSSNQIFMLKFFTCLIFPEIKVLEFFLWNCIAKNIRLRLLFTMLFYSRSFMFCAKRVIVINAKKLNADSDVWNLLNDLNHKMDSSYNKLYYFAFFVGAALFDLFIKWN